LSKNYDAPGSVNDLKKKSDIDIDDEDTIPLCDICSNVKLLSYQHNILICPACDHIENSKYEHIQSHVLETTVDEILGRGEITFKGDTIPASKTKNRLENNHENQDYVIREFERFRQRELVARNSRKLNKRLQ